MVTKVQKWGNSQGLRLSKQFLDDLQISVGDQVDVAVQDGVIVCPVTPTKRDYPFPVPVDGRGKVTGFVMAEQIKSIDFRARRARRLAKAPRPVLEETLSILDACLY